MEFETISYVVEEMFTKHFFLSSLNFQEQKKKIIISPWLKINKGE
jgi:hypothetical protein